VAKRRTASARRKAPTPKPFFERLQDYFAAVSEALRRKSEAARVFPNVADVGSSRERLYAEFLRQSLPSACNVLSGGFLFNHEGVESGQMDVIVTADTCPQFNFLNEDRQGKTFSCIDGTLAVASLKSTLTKATLHEAIANLASLPPKRPLTKEMVNPKVIISEYDDWPYKIIFAPAGESSEKIWDALTAYFAKHRSLVVASPNLVHVAGKYSIFRTGTTPSQFVDGKVVPPFTWVEEADPTDASPFGRVIVEIQQRLSASRHILFDYNEVLSKFWLPPAAMEYVVKSAAEFYAEHLLEGQGPEGKLVVGQKVTLIHKQAEYWLVQLEDGRRVQVPKRSLRAATTSRNRVPKS
jgi:hypothetical protein